MITPKGVTAQIVAFKNILPRHVEAYRMNPNKVSRNNLDSLTDLPNIGKAGEEDLM